MTKQAPRGGGVTRTVIGSSHYRQVTSNINHMNIYGSLGV